MNSPYDDDVIQEIEARVNIVDIVGESIKLTRKGSRYWGLCPFHQEKTPSFTVTPDKNVFYCFGCHTGGNIFTFVMKKEGLDFKEALEKLAALAGVEFISRKANPAQKKRKDFMEVNKAAAHFFQMSLQSSQGQKAREYLSKRGLTEETCNTYQLGYALNNWQSLMENLTGRGYSAEIQKELGLIKRSDSQDRYFDIFRNRIVFPIMAVNGDILGFGGRALDNEDQPKYLNTRETIIYSKRNQLYGLHQGREAIKSNNQVYLVEGYMDCIKMAQFGFANTVASLGTALTSGQAELLRRYAEEVVIIFDGDEAGQRETLRAIEVLSAEGMKVFVIALPEGMDPDSFADLNEKKEFYYYIQNKKISYIHYKLQYMLIKEKHINLTAKIKVLNELKSDLQQINSPIELEHYIRILSHQLQLEENVIKRELRLSPQLKNKAVYRNKTEINRDIIKHRKYTLEERILAIMLTDEAMFEKIGQAVGYGIFQEEKCQQIMDEFMKLNDRFTIPWSVLVQYLSGQDLASALAKLASSLTEENQLTGQHIDGFIKQKEMEAKAAHWKDAFERLNAVKNEGDFQDLLKFIINLDLFLTQEGGENETGKKAI